LIKKIVIGKLKELYFKAWKTELVNDDRREGNQTNRLRTYRLFKQNFNFEPYLNILNFKQRQALTKLRIGNHRLEIELGRHKHIKAADRIYKICKDGVEDETHFLVKCKNFDRIITVNFIQRFNIIQLLHLNEINMRFYGAEYNNIERGE
jgi:hypothetical protein